MVTGFFGGMAGCAMIGQSMVNMKSGGRTRLSTFVSGIFLLFLILVLGDVVKQIPMGALVGVMFMVSISTFDWSSLKSMLHIPLSDALVMLVTVVTVVATDNLSIGVLFGVIAECLIVCLENSLYSLNGSGNGYANNLCRFWPAVLRYDESLLS